MADVDDIDNEFCEEVNVVGCSPEFQDLAEILMRLKGYTMPETAEEGVELFLNLKNIIEHA